MFLKVHYLSLHQIKPQNPITKNTQSIRKKMTKRRSKKRNYLTMDIELAELAYVLHGNANRLRSTATHINITAAFRMQLFRMEQRMVELARSLGIELDQPDQDAFMTKDCAERVGDQLGLFDS